MDSQLSEPDSSIIIAEATKKTRKPRAKACIKPLKEDAYSAHILGMRLASCKASYAELSEIKESTGLPIRHANPPEDITENIAKFIIQNYDNDPSVKWAKSIGKKGDIYSEKYPEDMQPEVKAFTSDGPSSFGPVKKFGVIYFLDLRGWMSDSFILWKVHVTNDSPEWKNMKMNKTQTHEDQCDEGKRPRISWDNIYNQLGDLCVKIYDGTFDNIFTHATTSNDSL